MSDTPRPIFEPSRELYDAQDDARYAHISEPWLREEVVRQISADAREPLWMLENRLKALEIFRSRQIPTWGPDLSALDLESIHYYARPEGAGEHRSWEDVPTTIKDTFERLGIPEAERRMLAGVGAQYDSEAVYHSLQEDLVNKGVIFCDLSSALRDHELLVREYFMRCVPAWDHTFTALHGAVWSGGTFLYVPAGVVIRDPLQSYFRMNARSGGQFEHTLIILEEGASAHYIEGCSAPKYNQTSLHAGCVEIFVKRWAHMRYSSVENWSTDTYNLNTKRAIVDENASVEWVGGNLWSGVTMLYPCSILRGEGASARHIGVAFAGAGQNTETGAKVLHLAPRTSSEILSKSLSKGGGRNVYRGLVRMSEKAIGSRTSVQCDGLLLDNRSHSDTFPTMQIAVTDALVSHEASVGRLGEAQTHYLTSRGLSLEAAKSLIVSGFLSPIVRELPLEYASEMNALIAMEMEGV